MRADVLKRCQQRLDVFIAGAMVGDVDADCKPPGDTRGRGSRNAALLQLGHDGLVECVLLFGRKVVGAQPEAGDVERNRRHQLPPSVRRNPSAKQLRQPAVVLDGGGELARAVLLQREPDLQRAETARQLGAEVARPRLTGSKTSRVRCEIGRPTGKGRTVRRAIAHQHAPGVVGHMQPFVEIEGERVCPLDAGKARAQGLAQHRHCREGAIDMQPDTRVGAQLGDVRQRIDGSGIDRARAGNDGERVVAASLVGADGGLQRRDVEAEIAADGN